MRDVVAKKLGVIQELQHAASEDKAFLKSDGAEFKIKFWKPAPDMIHGMATIDIGDRNVPIFFDINDCYVRINGDEWWYDGLIKKATEER